jgi:hypothetical protein
MTGYDTARPRSRCHFSVSGGAATPAAELPSCRALIWYATATPVASAASPGVATKVSESVDAAAAATAPRSTERLSKIDLLPVGHPLDTQGVDMGNTVWAGTTVR